MWSHYSAFDKMATIRNRQTGLPEKHYSRVQSSEYRVHLMCVAQPHYIICYLLSVICIVLCPHRLAKLYPSQMDRTHNPKEPQTPTPPNGTTRCRGRCSRSCSHSCSHNWQPNCSCCWRPTGPGTNTRRPPNCTQRGTPGVLPVMRQFQGLFFTHGIEFCFAESVLYPECFRHRLPPPTTTDGCCHHEQAKPTKSLAIVVLCRVVIQ